MKISFFITFLAASHLLVHADNIPAGEKIYQQLCAACHGQDGKGVGDFPPLAHSKWVQGDPDRVAQILFHGLKGPIQVNGKSYNLQMYPQEILKDAQKVEVINYLRSTWGDDPEVYNLEKLHAAKLKSKGRIEPWTQTEILKLYPLAKEKPSLTGLIKRLYHGKWSKLPDFSKLEVAAVEEEHEGFISLKKINRKQNYGLVWTGQIIIPEDGDYIFELSSDDGSRLLIDHKVIVEMNSRGNLQRKNKGSSKLSKGKHDFRFEFFQEGAKEGIVLRFKKKDSSVYHHLSDPTSSAQQIKFPEIDLTPKSGDPIRIYNNFIADSNARAIAVGFPEQIHYAFNTQHCSLDLLWSGKFISGGRHWTARGQGAQPPSAKSYFKIGSGKPSWFIDSQPAEVQFKGYTLNQQGNPTLKYSLADTEVTEIFKPSASGMSRTIQISSVPKNLKLQLQQDFSGKITANSVQMQAGLKLQINAQQGKLETSKKKLFITGIPTGPLTITLDYSCKK